MSDSKNEIAVFGGGCFWCTEAVFDELRGVHSVVSGYAGGATKNPTYEQVCSGQTGHAEVIKIEFDPGQISFRDLMTVFFATHDPTTLNRQGNDAGTQYRSAILYANDEQKQQAAAFIKELDDAKTFKNPVVTTLEPLAEFYPAEDYHQKFYANNPYQPYCQYSDPTQVEQAPQAVFAAAQVPWQVELRGIFCDLLGQAFLKCYHLVAPLFVTGPRLSCGRVAKRCHGCLPIFYPVDQTLLGSSTIRQKSLNEGFGTAQWMKQLISAAKRQGAWVTIFLITRHIKDYLLLFVSLIHKETWFTCDGVFGVQEPRAGRN